MSSKASSFLVRPLSWLRYSSPGPLPVYLRPSRSSRPATGMSPKTLSPNISMRLKTRSGLRRESPAVSRLTSACAPRIDTRCPRLRSALATWGTTASYSFEFSSSLSRYVRTVIFMVTPAAPCPSEPGKPAGLHTASDHRETGGDCRLYPAVAGMTVAGSAAPPSHGVGQLVRGPCAVSPHFGFSIGSLDRQGVPPIIGGLWPGHAPGVQP